MENRVERLRKERGLNQEEFAKAIRVSRQTVSSIETGKYNPSLDLAFTIADFLERRSQDRERGCFYGEAENKYRTDAVPCRCYGGFDSNPAEDLSR